MTTQTTPDASNSRPADPEAISHINTIDLVGELGAPAEVRQLPDGSEVVSFRVVARTESASGRLKAKPSTPIRSDSIDCTAGADPIRKRLLSYQAGDLVEVSGALRHRYWRGASGLNSRYEVEAMSVRRLRSGG